MTMGKQNIYQRNHLTDQGWLAPSLAPVQTHRNKSILLNNMQIVPGNLQNQWGAPCVSDRFDSDAPPPKT